MVVVIEFNKLVLHSAKETEGERHTKKNHLLEQAANVLDWMYEFDPQKVKFNQVQMPSSLRKLGVSGKEFVKDFPIQMSRIMTSEKRFAFELQAAND